MEETEEIELESQPMIKQGALFILTKTIYKSVLVIYLIAHPVQDLNQTITVFVKQSLSE